MRYKDESNRLMSRRFVYVYIYIHWVAGIIRPPKGIINFWCSRVSDVKLIFPLFISSPIGLFPFYFYKLLNRVTGLISQIWLWYLQVVEYYPPPTVYMYSRSWLALALSFFPERNHGASLLVWRRTPWWWGLVSFVLFCFCLDLCGWTGVMNMAPRVENMWRRRQGRKWMGSNGVKRRKTNKQNRLKQK